MTQKAKLVKKFDVLMELKEYQRLLQLSENYGISMGAIVRLALRDLYQKIDSTTGTRQTINPILKNPAQSPPPEMDDFWRSFRS